MTTAPGRQCSPPPWWRGWPLARRDRDQDGWVSLNELYDYIFDKVRERNPHQTPSRDVEMQGELHIARRSRPVTTPAPLPPELQQAVDHPLAGIRAGAIQELVRVLQARHAGLVLAARLALEHLTEDDSRAVSAAAAVLSAGAQPAEAAEPTPPRLALSATSIDFGRLPARPGARTASPARQCPRQGAQSAGRDLGELAEPRRDDRQHSERRVRHHAAHAHGRGRALRPHRSSPRGRVRRTRLIEGSGASRWLAASWEGSRVAGIGPAFNS
jgi:hypothetical protein